MQKHRIGKVTEQRRIRFNRSRLLGLEFDRGDHLDSGFSRCPEPQLTQLTGVLVKHIALVSVEKGIDMVVRANGKRNHRRVRVASLENETIAVLQFLFDTFWNASFSAAGRRWGDFPLDFHKNLADTLIILARRALQAVQVFRKARP